MIKKLLFISIAISSMAFTFKGKKDDKPAYKIFNSEGKEVSYDDMVKELSKKEVNFFGELHNNPIAHWLQLQLTKEFYESKKDKLVLAAEMFEADDQIIMDEYLLGAISEKSFKDETKLWPNYETDYKPLVEFAKTNKLAFICANIPRRYASIVYKKGLEKLDSLDTDGKKCIAPLPIEYDGTVKCYKEMLENSGGHGGDNLPKAQAIKDATMGWFVSQAMKQDGMVLHFNGSYHSDNGVGIIWYLKKYKPEVKVGTITTVLQTDLDKLADENKGKADFIIVVPEDMTTTH
jgi:uncharacterized iron-regulated protein